MNVINKIKYFAMTTISQLILVFRVLVIRASNIIGKHYCPICKSNVRYFLSHGDPPRANAKCPVCGSIERHRLDWLLLEKHINLFDGFPKTMRHVAPEEFLAARFKRVKNLNYLSADLYSSKAMVDMDITNINYPDNTFLLSIVAMFWSIS